MTSNDPIDTALAASLGWPKLKYAFVERERRWLCADAFLDRVIRAEVITDLYVTGTRLRLREAVPIDGGAPLLRLARKADVRSDMRLITSLYLSAAEFALLVDLPGKRLRKTRHHLPSEGDISMSVDVFHDALQGLVMAEAEFPSDEAMHQFRPPEYFSLEVTHDARYAGSALVERGLPGL